MNTTYPDDFKRCIEFHGHVCGGLAIGYKASKAAMAWLKEHRADDEELVAVVENDACGVDAVQVLTGCTFGKGNFIYKDYGKMAFTFFSRTTGKGVRVAPKNLPLKIHDDRQKTLFDKVRNSTATDEEARELRKLTEARANAILDTPLDDLFTLNPAMVPVPEKARIARSEPCNRCGEPVMATKLENLNGEHVCRGCIESL